MSKPKALTIFIDGQRLYAVTNPDELGMLIDQAKEGLGPAVLKLPLGFPHEDDDRCVWIDARRVAAFFPLKETKNVDR